MHAQEQQRGDGRDSRGAGPRSNAQRVEWRAGRGQANKDPLCSNARQVEWRAVDAATASLPRDGSCRRLNPLTSLLWCCSWKASISRCLAASPSSTP